MERNEAGNREGKKKAGNRDRTNEKKDQTELRGQFVYECPAARASQCLMCSHSVGTACRRARVDPCSVLTCKQILKPDTGLQVTVSALNSVCPYVSTAKQRYEFRRNY